MGIEREDPKREPEQVLQNHRALRAPPLHLQTRRRTGQNMWAPSSVCRKGCRDTGLPCSAHSQHCRALMLLGIQDAGQCCDLLGITAWRWCRNPNQTWGGAFAVLDVFDTIDRIFI